MKLIIFLFLYAKFIRAQKDVTCFNVTKNLKLDLVQVIFRHGERTCINEELLVYKYLNESVYEPYGLGQLTNNGKKQMYHVGRYLKKRYGNLTSEKNYTNQVYAYSSEDDRTKMSLQLVLAGLYPPSTNFTWNTDLEWIPLPYRYTPKQVDILMKSYSSKKYKRLTTKIIGSPEFSRSLSKYKRIVDLTKNLTGRHSPYYVPGNIAAVFNVLHIHENLKLPIPNWYTSEIKTELREVYGLIGRSGGQTAEQNRLNGGTMIRTFLSNMNVNGTMKNPRKIYLYSGHDLTINGILLALGINDFDIIDFGMTLIVEKFHDSNNQIFIRILVYNPIDDKTIVMKIGNCEEFCSLNYFLKHIQDVLPNDEEMYTLIDEFNVDKLKELFFEDHIVKKP